MPNHVDPQKGKPMPAILAPAPVKATTPPSPETVAWAAGCLAEIGFTPEDARWFGLTSSRASELEAAMADLLAAATLEASRR